MFRRLDPLDRCLTFRHERLGKGGARLGIDLGMKLIGLLAFLGKEPVGKFATFSFMAANHRGQRLSGSGFKSGSHNHGSFLRPATGWSVSSSG